MWRADPSGKFEFSDVTYNPSQTLLSPKQPNFTLLKSLIITKFKGKKIKCGHLKDFVITETPFLETHYKTAILKTMEKNGEIKVNRNGAKAGSYTDEVVLEFL